ncbi:UbiA family prenyltransferase [Novosphingobium panipatense]
MRIGIGVLSAIAIASANYVINEWLDRESDAHHPVKYRRTAVSLQLAPEIVYLQYAIFAVFGLLLASVLGSAFLVTSAAFLLSGLVYNVRPVRSKDRPFLDVISESVNNPIRLGLGWLMMDPTSLPRQPHAGVLDRRRVPDGLEAPVRIPRHHRGCGNGGAPPLSQVIRRLHG